MTHEDRVDLAVEVGAHAGQSACEAIARVVNTLPDNSIKLLATVVAFSYIQQKLHTLRKEIPFIAELIDGLNDHLNKSETGKPDHEQNL